jgi:hypothetical protein
MVAMRRGLAMVRRHRAAVRRMSIAGGVLIETLLASVCLAQTQQPASPPKTIPQASSPVQKTAPRQGAEATTCLYDDKRFSVGAGVCLSNQLVQTCLSPDNNHSSNWWWTRQEPLCNGATAMIPGPR